MRITGGSIWSYVVRSGPAPASARGSLVHKYAATCSSFQTESRISCADGTRAGRDHEMTGEVMSCGTVREKSTLADIEEELDEGEEPTGLC
jgi:hypothetical protein